MNQFNVGNFVRLSPNCSKGQSSSVTVYCVCDKYESLILGENEFGNRECFSVDELVPCIPELFFKTSYCKDIQEGIQVTAKVFPYLEVKKGVVLNINKAKLPWLSIVTLLCDGEKEITSLQHITLI